MVRTPRKRKKEKKKRSDVSIDSVYTRDAERSKQDILAVAAEEFAGRSLGGARVDQIAERTRTSKRMIYYYFNGKEGLYRAVLEKAYRDAAAVEERTRLSVLEPRKAIRELIELTFDNHESHPQFVSLVSVENIHQAKHLATLQSVKELSASVIGALTAILERGRKEGVFRSDLDPLDVHFMISALCFFRVSNRHTFAANFDRDLSEQKMRKRHKKLIIETVERMLEPRADGG
jgi:AcrR family transcriptional regulator